jgi:hypothetical protein
MPAFSTDLLKLSHSLAVKPKLLMRQFHAQCRLVCALKQARAQGPVDLDGAANDPFSEWVMFIHGPSRSMRRAAEFRSVYGRRDENVAICSTSVTGGWVPPFSAAC